MLNEHQKKLVKMIQGLGEKYSTWSVFNDFLTMAATAISNAVDPVHREEREKLYMEAIGHYRKDEQSVFPEMFTVLVQAADQAMATEGPKDILGAVFHDLELHNKYKGQFFTPQSIADMTAQISGVQEPPEGKNYIMLCEPTCGSGVMVISAAKVLLKEKKSPAANMVALACDLDFKCTCMAYIQLSLYGIPAVVEHANTLTCEVFSRWYTPVYLWNGWLLRERIGITTADGAEDDRALIATLHPVEWALLSCMAMITDKKQEPLEEKSGPEETRPEIVEPELPRTVPEAELFVRKNGQMSLF